MKFVVEGMGLAAGGGKELALTLISHIRAHREHEFLLIVPDLPEYADLQGSNIRKLLCPIGRSLPRRFFLLNRQLPRICAQARADALLCLGNFAPRRPVCPTVVLVQNAWLVYPSAGHSASLTAREKLIIYCGRRALKRLSPLVRVIVQTEIMRERVLSLSNLSPERVTVVPNSLLVGPDCSDSVGSHPREDCSFTFLCLARYYTHKNLEVLIEAMKRLPEQVSQPAKCVITISRDQHPGASKLLKRIEDDQLAHVIRNIGPVSATERSRVYRSADAFILPTLLETFSFTYLEAMYFGLPILTSDRDFAHDRCQEAALYFDPLDADSVARAMAGVMEDEGLRWGLVENGRSVLARIPTWHEIADRFVEVLERAARGEPMDPWCSRDLADVNRAT